MSEQELVAMADQLTPEKVFAIQTAYAAAGYPHPKYAITAARQAGRLRDLADVQTRMVLGVQVYGFLNGVDVTHVTEAAKNVAAGFVTEDLIGKTAYSVGEYGQLVDPWFRGFIE